MAKREIGTSLKLDGEAQFKTAITNINQELRVLSSEMGAAVSAFDKSGASVSDLKAKGDIYEKQLESQREKLSVLQNAVETAREAQAKAAQTAAEMAEKYGANSDEAKKASEAVAGITKKLNDYQIQANNTTKNINQLEAAQRANTTELENFQSKLDSAQIDKLTNNIKSFDSELNLLASELGKVTSSYDKNKASANDLNNTNAVLEKQVAAQKEKQQALNAAISEASNILQSAKMKAAEMADTYGENSVEAENAAKAVSKAENALNDYQIQANNTTKNINQLEAAQRANNEEIENLRSKNHQKILEGIAEGAEKAASGVKKVANESVKISVDAVKALGTALGAAATAAGAVAVKLGKEVVEAYADYEQLVGGVDTLFKGSSDTLQQYAANAYKTAGMNANEYMETVTGFSASLIQSLGGDTEKAVEYASMAITDMSDNANKMGSDMGSIQNAYQGFAKSNFTMLDNLKLGYGGTKEEMQRLLDDAQAISGIEYNIDSYADIVSAIHVMQENMDIACATAKEAESTISGSINSMQSALQNFIVGLGNENADIGQLCQNVVDAFQNVVTNITPIIDNIVQALPTATGALLEAVSSLFPQLLDTLLSMLPDITSAILEIIQELTQAIVDKLPDMINSILPMAIQNVRSLVSGIVSAIPSLVPSLLKGAVMLFKGILDGLNQVIAQITPMLPQIVSDISSTLAENIPTLISGAAQFFAGIVSAIAEVVPSIIAAVVEIVPLICNSIIENIPLLIEAGLQLFVSLTESLPDAVVQIVAALPEIINGIISALLEAIPQIIQAGIDLFVALIEALPEIITTIVEALPQIITGIITALMAALPQLVQAGYDLLIGLIGALPDIIIALVGAIPQITEGLVTALIVATPELTAAGVELFTATITNLPQIIIEIVKAVPKIVNGIVDGFKENMSNIANIGKEIMAGIGDGIISGVTAVKDKINAAGKKIMNSFKDFFDIHSPSRKLKKEVGFNLADGVGIGFTEQMSKISADMQKSVPTSFDLDVEVDAAATARRRYGGSAGNNSGGISFTQNNYSPQALDAATINRQTIHGLQLANVIR